MAGFSLLAEVTIRRANPRHGLPGGTAATGRAPRKKRFLVAYATLCTGGSFVVAMATLCTMPHTYR